MTDPAEPHPDRAAAEVLLLHRRTPLAEQTAALRDRGQLSVPRAGSEERDEIVALIAAHQGATSADLARAVRITSWPGAGAASAAPAASS